MSKVGKLPVAIPAGVTVSVANGLISVKGPKGELKQSFHDEIDIKVEGTEVVLTTKKFFLQLRTMLSRQMLIMDFTEALSTIW